MTDEKKRAIIRALSKFDHLQSKSSRGGEGWRPTDLVYDDPKPEDTLETMTGDELSRELRRQLLATIPVALLIIIVVAAVIFAIVKL